MKGLKAFKNTKELTKVIKKSTKNNEYFYSRLHTEY